MDSPVVEAPPAIPHGPLAVADQIFLPAVREHIVFPRDVEHLAHPSALELSRQRVELLRLLAIGEIPGVEEEGGQWLQRLDLVQGRLQRGRHILVGSSGKADVAVADLDGAELPGGRRLCREGRGEAAGGEDPAAHGPQHARADPGHAFEEPAAVDAVVAHVVLDPGLRGDEIMLLHGVLLCGLGHSVTSRSRSRSCAGGWRSGSCKSPFWTCCPGNGKRDWSRGDRRVVPFSSANGSLPDSFRCVAR
jgi:hypothetical protein